MQNDVVKEYKYCNGCPFAYLCYGIDTENCESYKERMKKDLTGENNAK